MLGGLYERRKKGQKLNFSNGIAGMADIYTPHNIV